MASLHISMPPLLLGEPGEADSWGMPLCPETQPCPTNATLSRAILTCSCQALCSVHQSWLWLVGVGRGQAAAGRYSLPSSFQRAAPGT